MTSSQLPFLPAPGNRCRICDAALEHGSLACGVCGAVYGEQNRCPHCGVVAGVDRDRGVGRCRVCGKARIALADPATERSGRETALLRRAEAERRQQWIRSGVAVAFGGLALFALLVAAVLLATKLTVLSLVGFALAVAGGGGGAAFAQQARRATRHRRRLLADAERIVAADMLRSHSGSLAPSELARALGVETQQAELMLAEIEIDDFLHARVDTTGYVEPGPQRQRAADAAVEGEAQENPPEVAHRQRR